MKPWLKFAMPALCSLMALPWLGNASALAAGPAASASPWIATSGLTDDAARVLQAEIDQQVGAYGGTQVSPYEISYGAGDPIMVFANPLTGEFPTDAADRVEARNASSRQLSSLTTSYRYGCPYSSSGWTCFYQNIDFNHYSCPGGASPPCSDGGRLLEFQSCGTQSLAPYGFSGQTSSWVNNLNAYVSVYDNSGTHLWDESPGGLSAYVGDTNNDRADNFWIIC